eukprot:COSAG05_NODE_6259_length_989_cov_6.959559_1_plen_54_part_01
MAETPVEKFQEFFTSKKAQKVQFTIGRCMLCCTFLDDAMRVFSEWSSQVDYMGQ